MELLNQYGSTWELSSHLGLQVYINFYHLSNHAEEENSQGILLLTLILTQSIVLSFR